MQKNNIIKEIEEFIKYNKYDENLVGVIFYGSYANGDYTSKSDVDLIIVFKEKKENVKCEKKFKDRRYEYYEFDTKSIYKRIRNECKKGIDSALSIFGYGTLLASNPENEKTLFKLSKYARDYYATNWFNPISEDDKKYLLYDCRKSVQHLFRLLEEQNPYFDVYFGICLEKMRKTFNRFNCLSKLGTSKVYDLYKNKQRAHKQHQILPNDLFISMYIKCVECKTRNDKYQAIKNIYSYMSDDYDNNHEFIVKLNGRYY